MAMVDKYGGRWMMDGAKKHKHLTIEYDTLHEDGEFRCQNFYIHAVTATLKKERLKAII